MCRQSDVMGSSLARKGFPANSFSTRRTLRMEAALDLTASTLRIVSYVSKLVSPTGQRRPPLCTTSPTISGPRTCRGRLRNTVSADEKAKHWFRVISLPPLLGQPRAVNCLRLWPVSANEGREVTFGRGQPVGAMGSWSANFSRMTHCVSSSLGGGGGSAVIQPAYCLHLPVVFRERIDHGTSQGNQNDSRSSGVSSWKTRGATILVLEEKRNTWVMPFGTSPCQSDPMRR
jgi:hypothetical protein